MDPKPPPGRHTARNASGSPRFARIALGREDIGIQLNPDVAKCVWGQIVVANRFASVNRLIPDRLTLHRCCNRFFAANSLDPVRQRRFGNRLE